ncbi:AfsR/SARP family transcriptional regulator [Kribbella catacumbae]|uniref:AfsR/SARP family transcriptional regulator n=1 Tax=Kribbella catacumbae TaxID=460086 RepID=UPI000365ED33|nr:BTAD domain-containing putative transcriptional regulator [Kribbella catacumbae]
MEFLVLGSLQVLDGDGVVVEVSAARVRLLLSTLLLRPRQIVSLEDLIDELWGDQPPANPRAALQTNVARLRAVVGPRLVITKAPGYLIEAEPTDLAEFRRLVDESVRSTDALHSCDLLTRALSQWRGDPLTDTRFLRQQRVSSLVEERIRAIELLMDARLRLGAHAELVAPLIALTTAHPLRERFWGQRMLALYRSGQQAGALEAYDEIAGLLRAELGVDPGAELQRMRQQILTTAPELDAPGATWSPAASPAPPAEAGWVPRFQLPLEVRDFVGRAEEMERLRKALTAEDRTPLAVVTGPPGVGKTTAALRVARQLRASFPDGQLFVRLDGASPSPRDPADVLAELLWHCGTAGTELPESVEARAALLRARLAERRVLLFLDDARAAGQVRPLLPGAGGSAVIVTSRFDLSGLTALAGGTCVSLSELTPDEAGDLVVRLVSPAAIQADADAVSELAGLCGYLPLALRIAASNAALRPARGLSEYTAELRSGDRLAKLAVTGDQQAAVRGAFDLSYATLAPGPQRLFRLLGAAPGADVSAGAAGALADTGPDEAERLLEVLATASLLQRRTVGRYQFHDLLRLYSRELGRNDPEYNPAVSRLYSWYLLMTDAACLFQYRPLTRVAPEPSGPSPFPDAQAAHAWLDEERSNLVAMVRHAADTPLAEYSWQLADALRWYLSRQQLLADWRTTAECGLRAAQAIGNVRAEGSMLGTLGALEQTIGNPDRASSLAAAAADCYRQAEHTLGLASQLCNLGNAYDDQGEVSQAAEAVQEGVALFRSIGRTDLLDVGLLNLSQIYTHLGQLDAAIDAATESIAVSRSASTRRAALNNRGAVHRLRGDLRSALSDTVDALAIEEQRHEAAVHYELAMVYLETGKLDLAREHANRALATSQTGNRPVHEAEALNALGEICREEGRLKEAIRRHQEALVLAQAGAYRVIHADALLNLAAASPREQAKAYANQALALARDVKLRVMECRALAALADLTDDPRAAEQYADQAAALERETGYRSRGY